MKYNQDQLTLGELLELLEKQDESRELIFGFKEPHSYRGYYECIAFEPTVGFMHVKTIKRMIEKVIGETFTGYKGGDFHMTCSTPVFLSFYGDCGIPLTKSFIKGILACDE